MSTKAHSIFEMTTMAHRPVILCVVEESGPTRSRTCQCKQDTFFK
jgi:hypothetical protein